MGDPKEKAKVQCLFVTGARTQMMVTGAFTQMMVAEAASTPWESFLQKLCDVVLGKIKANISFQSYMELRNAIFQLDRAVSC